MVIAWDFAQAKAEERRAMAVAKEPGMKAVVEEMRAKVVTNAAENEGFLQFQPENPIQWVIWAEILGKPKAKKGWR